MALYYCTDDQVTTVLPTLTGTDLATAAARNTLLRTPAAAWIDSVYPGLAPFPGLSATPALDWLVNQSDHEAGDTTVTVDGGSGTPVAGDDFHVDGHNSWYKVISYAANIVTYTWVDSFRSGVETTTSGARAAFLDNSSLEFGTPILLQQASVWWARALAYQILRNSPIAEEAKASFEQAISLLQIGRDGMARARPWIYQADAWDASYADDPWSSAWVKLYR